MSGFVVIGVASGQCRFPSVRILEELSTTVITCLKKYGLWRSFLLAWGVCARQNLSPTRFTTVVWTFALWWHSKGKHISHFIAETSIAEMAAPNCPIPPRFGQAFYCFTVANALLGDASHYNEGMIGSSSAHAKQDGCRVRHQWELGARFWLFTQQWSSSKKTKMMQ